LRKDLDVYNAPAIELPRFHEFASSLDRPWDEIASDPLVYARLPHPVERGFAAFSFIKEVS